ncbi:MAG: GDP-mannose 4,6-dehydratase [Nevskiales bacterium]|nr:GDP-mannose 4,6-dehydratase [Nevskiales bacterium]
MKALICGISGQDGAYLAQHLLQQGYAVYGTSRDANSARFTGLEALAIRDRVQLSSMATNDFRSVLQTLRWASPDEVYNLAGQTSVRLSFEQPVETFESIGQGTLMLLEAIRFSGRPIRFYNAGSGECFGSTGAQAADEQTPFSPQSPYAVAKCTAHWTVANYRKAYGLHACTGLLFNHESPLRPVHFVTRKIVTAACRIAAGKQKILKLGNTGIVRDWGWAPEYVQAMHRMLQMPQAEDYVIATGESHSLEAFVEAAFTELGLDWRRHVETEAGLQRPSDHAEARANPAKAARQLGWRAQSRMRDVVCRMIAAEQASPP